MSETMECPACAMPTPSDEPECAVCGYEFPAAPASRPWVVWLFVILMLLFAFPALGWLFGLLG